MTKLSKNAHIYLIYCLPYLEDICTYINYLKQMSNPEGKKKCLLKSYEGSTLNSMPFTFRRIY